MVYVLLADGLETIEALAPVDMLRRAGVDVRTVSVKPDTLEVVSSQKVCVQADIGLDQLKIEDMSMLVIPGGMPGTTNLDHLEQMDELLQKAVAQNCYIAAICAGPTVPGKRGYLNGKQAICYPGFESDLHGAEICRQRVVQDGKMITAIGAGACIEFGLTLVRVLLGDAAADRIRESIH